jgi:hypothetical protein
MRRYKIIKWTDVSIQYISSTIHISVLKTCNINSIFRGNLVFNDIWDIRVSHGGDYEAAVFWDEMPCRLAYLSAFRRKYWSYLQGTRVLFYPKIGDNSFFWNVGKYVPNYTTSHPRTQQFLLHLLERTRTASNVGPALPVTALAVTAVVDSEPKYDQCSPESFFITLLPTLALEWGLGYKINVCSLSG